MSAMPPVFSLCLPHAQCDCMPTALLQGTQMIYNYPSSSCRCTTPTGTNCAVGQTCCNGNCVNSPGKTMSGIVTTQLCSGYTCCPLCRPIEGLPAWHGGTANQLACAVVAQAKKLNLPLWTQWSYIMGTIQRETGAKYTPLRECYDEGSSISYCDSYVSGYKPYYGRGYVQITWQDNYKKFQVRGASVCLPLFLFPEHCGLSNDHRPYALPQDIMACNLTTVPDLAMLPDVSLFITVYGMKFGTFTGAKLETYVRSTPADVATRKSMYTKARAVVNGNDVADLIATYALGWEAAVKTCP